MAQTTGTTDHPVEGEPADPATDEQRVAASLMEQPGRYGFYQAVRMLERLAGGVRLGHAELPRREAIRIRALDRLDFPPCDLTEITAEENPWGQPATRYRLTASFMGVYGPASPLPTNYTEMLVRPEGEEDPEDRQRVRDFLDLFHHRMFSLFYRCLSKYRYHLLFESGGGDVFSRYMLALIGRGTPQLTQEDRPVPAVRMIRYAGLLTQNPKSAVNLEGLLRDFLKGVPVRVSQCMGRWLRVEDRNRLGAQFCQMGEDLIVGANVYDRTGKFRVSVRPMGIDAFKRFLPNGETMAKLRELVRLYLVDHLEFDVEVWLHGDEVPRCEMGAGPGATMLGWTSWSLTGPGPDRAVVFRG